MPSNTDISKLKELYESLDRLKEGGEDVVAEIRKEINNIELQYLGNDQNSTAQDILVEVLG